VHAKQDGVDPVGACVGLRGIRIQNIVNELQGEKIDVIQWSRDDMVFISHALSPAQPLRVELDAEEQIASVIVPDRHLSLAIGREGQNARLAARLTGWKIDIKSSTEIEIERMKQQIEGEVAERAAASSKSEDGTAGVAEPIAAEVAQEAVEAVAEAEAIAAAPVAAGDEQEMMAELEAEAQAAQAPTESASGLSAEERLALESLDIEPSKAVADEEEIVIEEIEEVTMGDEIWKVAEAQGSGSQIRFAEDILGAPAARRAGGKRRRGGRVPRGGNRGPGRGGGRPNVGGPGQDTGPSDTGETP
jgi:N utilization substance protein A